MLINMDKNTIFFLVCLNNQLNNIVMIYCIQKINNLKIIFIGGLANKFKNDISYKPIFKINLNPECFQIVSLIDYAKK